LQVFVNQSSRESDLFGLILHRDHADEYLMALHNKTVVDALDRVRQVGRTATNQQRVGAAMVTRCRGDAIMAALSSPQSSAQIHDILVGFNCKQKENLVYSLSSAANVCHKSCYMTNYQAALLIGRNVVTFCLSISNNPQVAAVKGHGDVTEMSNVGRCYV